MASYVADVIGLPEEFGLDRFAFSGYADGAGVGYTLAALRASPAGRRGRSLPGPGHLGAFVRSDLVLPEALPFLRVEAI